MTNYWWPSATTWTSTASSTASSMRLNVVRDEDGSWIISDNATTVYGHGDTVLEAFADYWAALRSTLRVIEDSPAVERLQREARTIRWLLGLGDPA